MAIQYVTYKDARKEGTGLYYGRAIHPSTVDLEKLAEKIQRTCSLTKGDVLGVLRQLVVVMKTYLENSKKVELDGLGTFRLRFDTKGTSVEEEFKAANIKRVTCAFLAKGKSQNGVRTRTFLDKVQWVKAN